MTMRILDIQQRLQEVGRIRTGATTSTEGGRKRPHEVEHWVKRLEGKRS